MGRLLRGLCRFRWQHMDGHRVHPEPPPQPHRQLGQLHQPSHPIDTSTTPTQTSPPFFSLTYPALAVQESISMQGKNLHHEGPQNYLHGFIGPFLAKGNKSGYGIFATADRIVGVRSRRARALFLFGPAIAASGGSLYLAQELAFHEPLMTTRMFSVVIFTILGLAFSAVVMLKPLRGLRPCSSKSTLIVLMLSLTYIGCQTSIGGSTARIATCFPAIRCRHPYGRWLRR